MLDQRITKEQRNHIKSARRGAKRERNMPNAGFQEAGKYLTAAKHYSFNSRMEWDDADED